MPTVMRFAGLRVVIYPNDHRPAHVHIMGAGAEAVFILHCHDGSAQMRESYGFSLPDLRRIGEMVGDALAVLCEEWRKHHGDD